MIDYSFIRLKDNFAEAKNVGNSPISTHFDNTFIQLATNEAYLQITNVSGGISFGGDYTVDVVDCSNISLKDVTDRVFIEEFTDSQGEIQCSIEYVNLAEDFYRQTVYFRIKHNISDVVFWSNGLNITDYQQEQTTFFEYKNYDDFVGIGYTNSQKYQAIRLRTYFDIPLDSTEITEYYQISRSRITSPRALEMQSEQYQIDYIDSFSFQRLNKLIRHNVVYIDNVRQTNKAVVESSEREGNSNWFTTNFTISKNYNDTKEYAYQIYEPLEAISFNPFGNYSFGTVITEKISITYNHNIDLGSGVINLYKVGTGLISSYDANLFTIVDNKVETINNITLPNDLGTYYFNVPSGFVSSIGIDNEAITNNTTWSYTVANADYSSADYSNEYFIN